MGKTEKSCKTDTWAYFSEKISELETRLSRIGALRKVNLNVSSMRPDETHFMTLDSSIKKNTAFVKKLKCFSAAQLDHLLQEMKTLNLTKYLGEVAGALQESKLKVADIPKASEFCSVVHHYYCEFSALLFESWTRIFNEDSSRPFQNESKTRTNLLFFADTIITGVCSNEESFTLLQRILSTIISSDMEDHLYVNLVLTFCKYCGYDFAGLIPRSIQHLATIYGKTVPESNFITSEKQRYIKALLREYHIALCKHVLRMQRELLRAVREVRCIYKLKGEVDAGRKKITNDKLLRFQNFYKSCMDLGEYFSEETPLFLRGELLWIKEIKFEEDEAFSSEIWEDEESYHFYEQLPIIKDFLPTFNCDSPESHCAKLGSDKHPELNKIEEAVSPRNMNARDRFKVFLKNLPNCVNREMIDNFSVNFAITYNTKSNRKQLVRTLFASPRARVDLLPFYARLVATLSHAMPEIARDVETLLLKEFWHLCRNKSQTNIQLKLRVVKFVGELVKFRAFSMPNVLNCLKWLLLNFSHPHHIEMFCSLMDTCGTFLFKQSEYHQRVKLFLEEMMRKKAACVLDARYTTMMENTYYQVNPPDRESRGQKCRPLMHEYIRKLLYQELDRNSSENVLTAMRKLDWQNKELIAYAIKCLTNAANVKYHNIRTLAEVVCGLSYYHELVGLQVVDAVLEDIKLGMELNMSEHNQSSLAMVKYLGELHNYYLVDTEEVLDMLYLFITFGFGGCVAPRALMFRVRLACALLCTAGPYMEDGGVGSKLDAYLVILQKFLWCAMAGNPPALVVHLLNDMLQQVRPNLKLFNSREEPRATARKSFRESGRMALPEKADEAGRDTTPKRTPDDQPCKDNQVFSTPSHGLDSIVEKRDGSGREALLESTSNDQQSKENPDNSSQELLCISYGLNVTVEKTDECGRDAVPNSTSNTQPCEERMNNDTREQWRPGKTESEELAGRKLPTFEEHMNFVNTPLKGTSTGKSPMDHEVVTGKMHLSGAENENSATASKSYSYGDCLVVRHQMVENRLMDRKNRMHGDCQMNRENNVYRKYPLERKGHMHRRFPINANRQFYGMNGEYNPIGRNGQIYEFPVDGNNQYSGSRVITGKKRMHRQYAVSGKSHVYEKNFGNTKNFNPSNYRKDISSKVSPVMVPRSSKVLCPSIVSATPIAINDELFGSSVPASNQKETKTPIRKCLISVLDDLQSQLEKLEHSGAQKNMKILIT